MLEYDRIFNLALVMRRTARLFEIIQILRSETRPITAEKIAELLEVSTRTIYRDIAALQAMRTPIHGEAGIGYMMRSGYDLPPLNFNTEEIEAIVVGLSLLSRTGDSGLLKAASRVSTKIDDVRECMQSLHVSDWGAQTPKTIDMSLLRQVIREEQKLQINYVDENDNQTERSILPIAIVYYIEVIVLVTWCELRRDFRHFRVDRIIDYELPEEFFLGQGDTLRQQWQSITE